LCELPALARGCGKELLHCRKPPIMTIGHNEIDLGCSTRTPRPGAHSPSPLYLPRHRSASPAPLCCPPDLPPVPSGSWSNRPDPHGAR
jgi:hypothetical protein